MQETKKELKSERRWGRKRVQVPFALVNPCEVFGFYSETGSLGGKG